MTTPSTERKAGPLLGTGAQTTWPFTFKVFAATDIAVTIANSLGVETALTYGVDYTVTLNANQETSPGGTVTYPISGSPLPTGSRLVIVGNLPYDQPLDLPSGGNFSPLALENQLDRLTMQIQQLRERLGRALQVSVTTGANVGLPAPSANELIGWDSTGQNLQNFALTELATAVAYATMRYDTFTGDGVETQFTLSADPVTLANLDVAISGVTQVPGSDYSLVNGVLVFASAPANGTEILARYGEGLVNVGGDSSDIRFLQAGSGAVDRTAESKLRETLSLQDFGVVGDGITDDTLAIQTAINALGALGHGRLIGASGASYKITSTIDFTVLGATTNWYEIDFAGAEFTWYGSQVGGDSMFYFFANKAVKVQNFTLFANSVLSISPTVNGIRIDSLQPGGADLFVFSDFRIRLANVAINLGSTTGGTENRVSDCRFEHFLLEGCNVGFQTNSTNCDSSIFTHGQLAGCATGFNFLRAGFNKIDTCVGYDCDPFIRIDGPIGPLTVINCQSEPETLPIGAFLYRIKYDSVREGVITLVGCNVNEKIWLDYDPLIGSDIQTLNLVGGYFTDLAIDAPDSRVNLIGTNQYPTGVLTIAGTNSRCFNEGSFIGGLIVDTAGGYRLVSPVDGVFTPTIVGTTSAGTATYADQVGSYTRVNDMCYFQIFLNWSGGTGTGNLRVAGLPFTSANNSAKAYGAVTIGEINVALTAGNYASALVLSSSTEIGIAQLPTGGGASAPVPYDAAGSLTISGWYKVA